MRLMIKLEHVEKYFGENHLNVYIYAPMDARLRTCVDISFFTSCKSGESVVN